MTIDLDDAFTEDEVEYPNPGSSSITITQGSGDVSYNANTGQNEASITFTAGEDGVDEGSTIEIELGGVSVEDDDSIIGNEYDVTFSYEDTDETTQFEIRED